ncbi:hypothetical protein RM572_00670 [Streptomyces sp. DSM 42041]|uniref:DUF4352 domain-containing protein n=1 Tax=Streptomyces hazeniae TaxID=3075538 RepID=A0ABU2NJW8_9ACTN|nr:hypothetical protein [Streptomyces sp. DSM 42041]MDT0377289.1 hypothetical protein [Streptomyces sp. DSM 42041]
MRRRLHARTAVAAALLTVGLLLSGCTTGSDSTEPAAGAKPDPSNSTTTGPSASPTKDTTFAIGEAWEWDDSELDPPAAGNTTVLAYTQPVTASITPDEEFGTTGYEWAALEVKVCANTGETWVNNMPWSLAYAGGARVQPSQVTYGDFPRPAYPFMDTTVKAGDCVRGNIVFPVPGDERPEKVVYAPGGSDTVVEWTVPEK